MILISENSGIRCIKLSLILFTVIFVITGISLVIIGTTIDEIFVEFSHFLGNIYFSPASLLTTVGLITFGISCFGCVGAVKESVFMIMTFGLLLGVTSFLQLVAGISNYLIMGEISKEIESSINKTMVTYGSVGPSMFLMDNLQQELHCCGIHGPKDWSLALYGNISAPQSCCSIYSEGICEPYHFGCYYVLDSILENSCRILIVSAYLLAFTQIFGMIFALYLGKILRDQKIARNYRRWLIRNQLLNNINESFYIPFNPFQNEKTEKENPAKACVFQ